MSPDPRIVFGTDGWRGVIADTFTFANVRRVAQAVAGYIASRTASPKGVVIGFDNRFQGASFAREVAEVMLGNGIPVCLCAEPMPTPAISFATRHHGLDGGVMITASHNPAEYNGLKFKTPQGASADPTVTGVFEATLDKAPVRRASVAASKSLVLDLSVEQPYLDWVGKFVDRAMLARQKYRVVVDSMYGVGKTYIEQLLAGTGHDVTTIRAERNPTFNGIAPEPVPKNLAATAEAVRACRADVACITDGDADRIAALDSNCEYVITPRIAVIIAQHLLKNRGWTGSIIKTISCSMTLDRFARAHGLRLDEKAVGFKNIVPYLISGDALVGTEESGGLGIKGHIPERDGILGSLMLVEALCGLGFRNAGEATAWLDREYGALRYHRVDRQVDPASRDAFYKAVEANPPRELLGKKVVRIKDFDGVKFECEDDSWLLLRFSGTEPLVRFYAEGPSMDAAVALTELGRSMIQ